MGRTRRPAARPRPAHPDLQRLRPRLLRPRPGPLRPGVVRPATGRADLGAEPHDATAPRRDLDGRLVALAYANLYPEAVATLTVVGPAGLGERPRPQRLLRNDVVAGFVARHFGRRLLEDHLGHNVRDPGLSARLVAVVRDAYRYEGSLYAFFQTLQDFPLYERQDLFRRTGTLGRPVLLVWGDDDQVTPIAHLDTVHELLRPRQTHVITGCGHMAPFERPHDVGDLLASFAVPHPDRLEP
ncbi:alpha/beta fold hydrolase [Amycolatopsis sp. NPDC051102]|uniref:alpha/beta fold hydrolase n=1 Tax=Amycolatopsis sp. NPDC051102 TaxID=3155163 RepID=UPI00343DE017